MTNLYESSIEAATHDEAIASLVEETHLPEAVVRRAYENKLVQLKPGARVKDYLLLLTVRKTREALRTSAEHPQLGLPTDTEPDDADSASMILR